MFDRVVTTFTLVCFLNLSLLASAQTTEKASAGPATGLSAGASTGLSTSVMTETEPVEITIEPDSSHPIEIFGTTIKLINSPSNLLEVVQQKIRDARSRDKAVKVVAVVDDGSHIELTSVDKANIEVARWEFVTLVTTRLLVSGGSTLLSLHYFKHVGLSTALGDSITAGLMSAGIAFFAKALTKYQGRSFLTSPTVLDWLKKRNIKVPQVTLDKIELGEAMGKFMSLEYPFVLILNFAEWYFQQPQTFHADIIGHRMLDYITHDVSTHAIDGAVTAAGSVASQGVVEGGMTKETELEIESAKSVAEVQRARRKFMVLTTALSAISVASAAVDNGNPLFTLLHFKITAAKIVFVAVAAAGYFNFQRVQKNMKAQDLLKVMSAPIPCRELMQTNELMQTK